MSALLKKEGLPRNPSEAGFLARGLQTVPSVLTPGPGQGFRLFGGFPEQVTDFRHRKAPVSSLGLTLVEFGVADA